MMVEVAEQELKRRLNLYQVFLKLYEHHSNLLDEILQLENLDKLALIRWKSNYVQGTVDENGVYLTTNLCENKTQKLKQPQKIWLMGRDQSCGIPLSDRYLSRRHAVIQYIETQGFYLIDLKSTNGTYVNGELVSQPIQLQDGDRIRLGNTTFNFFCHQVSQILPPVSLETLLEHIPKIDHGTGKTKINHHYIENAHTSTQRFADLDETGNLENSYYNVSTEKQSEILDRFLNRHARQG
jgi:pSer/pThr/pTyr-binding forkhead associated (FHA) protein